MTRIFKHFSIAVLLLALCAIVVAGCGSKSSSEDVSPTQAIQDALDKTSTITSGKAELKGSLAIGAVPGTVAISGGGPFDTKAEGGPAFELVLSLGIAGTEQKLGFVAVDGKNYMVVGDRAIEQKSEDGAALDGGQIADYIKGLGKYISNAKEVADNTYTADVDVKKLLEASEDEAGASGFKIPGLGSLSDLKKSVGTATLKVVVDSEGYASTIDINLPVTSDGSEGGVRLTINLTEINQPQTIEKPKNVVDAGSALGGLGSALAQ